MIVGKRTARRPLPRFGGPPHGRVSPRALPPALAEHYGVSGATVTRTLRILADEGLVRTVPRWGTFRAGDSGAPRQPVRANGALRCSLLVVLVLVVPAGNDPRGLEAEVCADHRAVPLRPGQVVAGNRVVRSVIRDTLLPLSLSGMTT